MLYFLRRGKEAARGSHFDKFTKEEVIRFLSVGESLRDEGSAGDSQ
jgi:hypothetical protein